MPFRSEAGWNNLTWEAYSVDDYIWASQSSLLLHDMKRHNSRAGPDALPSKPYHSVNLGFIRPNLDILGQGWIAMPSSSKLKCKSVHKYMQTSTTLGVHRKRNWITLHAAEPSCTVFTNSPVQDIHSCFLSHRILRVWKKASESCCKTPISFWNKSMQLLIVIPGAWWRRRTCSQRCDTY